MKRRFWWGMFEFGWFDEETKGFSAVERGAWISLVRYYWTNGPIVDSPTRMARVAGVDHRSWARVWRAICPLFVRGFDPDTGDPVWRYEFLDRSRERAKYLSQQRSLAGAKGAAVSHGRNNNERFIARQLGPAIARQPGATTTQKDKKEASQEGGRKNYASPSLRDIIEKKGWPQ